MAGADVSQCESTLECVESRALLDPTGAHAVGCRGIARTRAHTHSLLLEAVRELAVEAGTSAIREPSTAGLLGDEFSAEQCRSLFPKRAAAGNQQAAELAADLAKKITDINTPHRELRSLHAELSKQLTVIGDDGVGRRVDVAVSEAGEQDLWIDVSVAHSTANSYLAKTACWFAREVEAEEMARATGIKNVMDAVLSPVITDAVKRKYNTYSLLTQLAVLQHAKRARRCRPKFLACIISHEGEMSSDVFTLIEDLTKLVKKAAAADFLLGYSPVQIAAQFRRRAKDRIATAVAAGFGRTLASIGYPTPLSFMAPR